jgi:voltage-gated potassium channel
LFASVDGVVVADARDGGTDRAVEAVFYRHDRVSFLEWGDVSGGWATVVATGAVAVLAFVTGLSNLSGAPPLDGPLTAAVAVPPSAVGVGSVLLAFALGGVTAGLRSRKRIAWLAAVILVPATAAVPLSTFGATDVPLLGGVGVAVPLLVRNRDRFDRPLELSPLQIASLSTILGVGLYGTVGAYSLRNSFLELDTWGDAAYYVVVTVATVGYGDITPTTPQARLFSASVILFGTGAFTIAVGALVAPVIESRMATAFGVMTASDLTLVDDHVVVLGYGDLTEALLTELGPGTDVVVVTTDPDVASRLESRDLNVLTGDPADESTLQDARVDAARGVVVGSDDDARDVLAVVATRAVAPDVRVVAAATEGKHVDKFRRVGADEVVDPRAIGGRLLGRSVMGRDATGIGTGLGEGDGDDGPPEG